MNSFRTAVIAGLLIGIHLTLLAWLVLTVLGFGRVVGQSLFRSRVRFHFRLRTLFIVATVIQAALALAVWQSQGAALSPVGFLWLFGFDFLFLGLGGWVLWYVLEEFLRLHGWEHSVYRRYHARRESEIPAGPAHGNLGRHKRWWTKKWENRYRAGLPGQDHTHPIGRDKF